MVQNNKGRMEVQSVVWQEVTRTPSGRFILFSISNSVNGVLTLHGDTKALVLSKLKKEVKFYIKPLTTKGAL